MHTPKSRMATFFNPTIILFILTIFSHAIASSKPHLSDNNPNPIRGAYYPSWTTKLKPSAINTTFFTHIYYAFLVPHNTTFKLIVNDQDDAPLLRQFISSLRSKTPPVKTLFSIGGGGADPTIFSRMAANRTSRSVFINSTIDVARTYKFDGFDLDWEFPKNTTEMKNLDILLKEWRDAVEYEAKAKKRSTPLLITAAVYYSADKFLDGTERSYPVKSINDNLDWINVMNYDYHGAWDPSLTGAHAALFDPKSNLSTAFGIGTWIRAGVLREKLIMGMPMYGKTWTLKNLSQHGVGAKAVGVGPGDDGSLTYAEVVSFNKDKNVIRGVFDKETVSAYSYSVSNRFWVGYDDPTTVKYKVGFARALNLGGYFFWAIDQDYKWEISKTLSTLGNEINQHRMHAA
ncbi:hypothetical protein CASFOL_026851 [Castilleja foliolosa]|uniref:GH18 domain-containing protein n=1 Tax=Castilleja foliolosa TaxID=1961234 RepID=A0ABD3CK74_9LAMI